MPPEPERLLDLFGNARVRDRADRAAFLNRECGPDADLRRRLDGLLAAWDEALAGPAPSQAPPPGPAASRDPYDLASPVGTTVAGRYRVEREIGEGGMGTVYLAEQVHPVRRAVALKLIRAGMDTRAVLTRFEAERQALAIMDHPHIARVLDAGTTESGRPYFVMELVRGVPLTDYCDRRRLDLPGRLELFRLVCSAVQHAHQKGVIHRDLKPSNILVEDHAGTPVPKVIDFGLAKAVGGAQLAERTLFTAHGVIHGTPRYMAPEQATYHAVDVDTRADIYALGVILYELLTGSTPIRPESLRMAALDEVLRVVREEEPPAPSDRIGSSESLPSLAASRHVEPARLGRLVRGDLDRVVLKALAKERERRYASAIGLADDLGRFLRDEPVAAGSPSAAYRLRKFVRRHRGRVAAVALLLLALVVGAAGTTLGLFEARRQGREAERLRGVAVAESEMRERARQSEASQRLQAERRLAQIERMNSTLGSIFADLDPRQVERGDRPLGVVLGERLEQAAAQLDGEAIGDPLTAARMRGTLGRSQLGLGHFDRAIAEIGRGQEALAKLLGPDHPDSLDALYHLAHAQRLAGHDDRAVAILERVEPAQAAALGPDNPATFRSSTLLAVLYLYAGRADRGIAILERTLPRQEAVLGAEHFETLEAMGALGYCYMDVGRFDEALRLIGRALDLQRANLGPDHPATLETFRGLGYCYQTAGRHAEALPILVQALDLTRKRYGTDHPESLDLESALGLCYQVVGQYDRAIATFERVLPLQRAKQGPDHLATLRTANSLAITHQYAGRVDRALALQAEVLERQRAKLGPDHPDTLMSMSNLGIDHRLVGQVDKAVPLLERALEGQRAKHGATHPWTLSTMMELGYCYDDRDQHDRALPLFREVAEARRRVPGADSAPFADAEVMVGRALLGLRRYAEAEPPLRECLAVRRRRAPDAWSTFYAEASLGASLLGQGKADEARPLLRRGYEGINGLAGRVAPADRGWVARSLVRLAESAEATGDPAAARAWREEQARVAAASTGPPVAPAPAATEGWDPETP